MRWNSRRKCRACGEPKGPSAFVGGTHVVCRKCERKKLEAMYPSAEKICTRCLVAKNVEDFHVRRASPDGRRPICKACAIELGRARYKENRTALDAYQREYRKTERGREVVKRYNDRQSSEVTDVYVRQVLRHTCGDVAALLPAEIVEAKRQHIRLNRELKGAKR